MPPPPPPPPPLTVAAAATVARKQAVDATPEAEPRYLVMQYIPTGTLQDLVRLSPAALLQRISASGQLRVAAARQIHAERYAIMRADADCLPLEVQIVALVGLFSALEYLAAVPMIHRDVKPVAAFVSATFPP